MYSSTDQRTLSDEPTQEETSQLLARRPPVDATPREEKQEIVADLEAGIGQGQDENEILARWKPGAPRPDPPTSDTPAPSSTPVVESPLLQELVRSKEIQDEPVPPSLIRSPPPQAPAQGEPEEPGEPAVPPSPPPPPPVPETPIPVAQARPVSTSSQGGSGTIPVAFNQESRIKKLRHWLITFIIISLILVVTLIAVPIALTRPDDSAASATNLTPSPPTFKCFNTTDELQDAVDAYLADSGNETSVAKTYGWPINEWCVGMIRNFSHLFSVERNPYAAKFNDTLQSWNVSSATRMRQMFLSAINFNQNLSLWNISQVSDMTEMFRGAIRFDKDLCSWQSVLVSGSIQVRDMFADTGCEVELDPVFNTTHSFACSVCPLAKPLCFQSQKELYEAVDAYLADDSSGTNLTATYGWPINEWCVSQVSNFSMLFAYARNNAAASFAEPVGSWNVSRAVDMREMFRGARSFNQDVSSWDIRQVTDMTEMFRDAVQFDQDLCEWQSILVGGNVEVTNMFLNTTCEVPLDPALTSSDHSDGYVCSTCIGSCATGGTATCGANRDCVNLGGSFCCGPVPDEIVSKLGPKNITTDGQNIPFMFANLPNSTGDVTLRISLRGDFDADIENATILGEGSPRLEIGVAGNSGLAQCSSSYANENFTIPMDTYNSWNGDAQIDILVDLSDHVNRCTDEDVIVALLYDPENPAPCPT